MTKRFRKTPTQWELPDPATGYELIDVCLKIPDTRLYREAFLGALYTLTKFWNWHGAFEGNQVNAAAAGKYWQQLLFDYLSIGGNCMACVMFRNNAQDPLLVETSCDDGATWQPAFRFPPTPLDSQTVINIQTNVDASTRLEILNRYDGNDVTTVNTYAPTPTYDADASDDREAALCMAVKAYVAKVVNDLRTRAGLAMGLSGVLVAVGLILPPLMLPIEIGAAVLGVGSAIAFEATGDQPAIDSVICCMVAGMIGQLTTRAKFQASLDNCGFGTGNHAAILTEAVHNTFADLGNWTAFIDGLGQAFLLAQAGVRDCPDCGANCEIFPAGNWSVIQGTVSGDGLTISSSLLAGVVMQLTLPGYKTVTSCDWFDSDTAFNVQTVTLEFWHDSTLIESHTYYSDYHNSEWADLHETFATFDPVPNCNRIVLINSFSTQDGTYSQHDLRICYQ